MSFRSLLSAGRSFKRAYVWQNEREVAGNILLRSRSAAEPDTHRAIMSFLNQRRFIVQGSRLSLLNNAGQAL